MSSVLGPRSSDRRKSGHGPGPHAMTTEDRGPRTEDPATAAPRPPARFAREITALALGPLIVWIIGWGHPYVYDATIALISALALHEFLALGIRKGYQIPIVL